MLEHFHAYYFVKKGVFSYRKLFLIKLDFTNLISWIMSSLYNIMYSVS